MRGPGLVGRACVFHRIHRGIGLAQERVGSCVLASNSDAHARSRISHLVTADEELTTRVARNTRANCFRRALRTLAGHR